MIRVSLSALIVTSLTVGSGCTDEAKIIEEPIQSSAQSKDHEFKVNQDTGKVEFTAEIVYFGFDDATLTEEGIERLTALADYMKQKPKLEVKIEGHCDDRGSPEYNLALGQQRSETVRKFLISTGIPEQRLAAISFGEEKPAMNGQGEDIWAKNRRAEFTFLNLQDEQTLNAKTEEKQELKQVDDQINSKIQPVSDSGE